MKELLFRLIDCITGKQSARQLEFNYLIAQHQGHMRSIYMKGIWDLQDGLGMERTRIPFSWSTQQVKEEFDRILERVLQAIDPRPTP